MSPYFINENLVELNDLMALPFYICLTKKYREFLIEKALDKKKNFKALAQEIGCCDYTLRHFKDYDKKFIKAEFLQRLLNLLNFQINDAEKQVISVNKGRTISVNIKLPVRAKPELALLLAKVMGDGCICSDYRFQYTNNQLDLINEIISAVNASLGESTYNLNNRQTRRTYEIKFSPVIGYILTRIGGPMGYKINQEFIIPEWIMNGDKKIKSYFLRGIFDDESTVDFRTKKYIKRITLALGI